MRRFVVCLISLGFAGAFPTAGAAQAPRHPLDPLTWEEHWVALETLRDAGRLSDSVRFTRLALKDPDNAQVWAWQPGQPPPRDGDRMPIP